MATYAVTTANDPLVFDTQLNDFDNKLLPMDANHFLIVFCGSTTFNHFAQILAVDTSTWAVTTAGARFEFDANATNLAPSTVLIDDTHVIIFFQSSGSDGFVQVLAINTTTWAVTTAAASLEFDTVLGRAHSAQKVDTNHFLNFYEGDASDGFAEIFEVNTTTWAVTTVNTRLEFDTQNGLSNSSAKIDTNHFINFWRGDAGLDGWVQVFEVNTTTWAVTTAGASLEFDTNDNISNACFRIDTTHYINISRGLVAGFSRTRAMVFEVNTTTWAVTTVGTPWEFDDGANPDYYAINQVDANHFIANWKSTDGDGFSYIFTVNTSTWAVTTASTPLEFETIVNFSNTIARIDTDHFLIAWGDSFGSGRAQVLDVDATDAPTFTKPSGLLLRSVG